MPINLPPRIAYLVSKFCDRKNHNPDWDIDDFRKEPAGKNMESYIAEVRNPKAEFPEFRVKFRRKG
ncbi:MAG: hypothetical protein KKB31_05385 [Nanoarchaeota archaeon]|nr:hypothetical protein [Nanoarchaeota archaeon]